MKMPMDCTQKARIQSNGCLFGCASTSLNCDYVSLALVSTVVFYWVSIKSVAFLISCLIQKQKRIRRHRGIHGVGDVYHFGIAIGPYVAGRATHVTFSLPPMGAFLGPSADIPLSCGRCVRNGLRPRGQRNKRLFTCGGGGG